MKFFVGIVLFVLIQLTYGEDKVYNDDGTGFELTGTENEITKVTSTKNSPNLTIRFDDNGKVASNALKDLGVNNILLTGKKQRVTEENRPTLTLEADTFQGLPNLEKLAVKRVILQINGHPLAPLGNLKTLILKLVNISAVPIEMLASLPKLKTLSLQANHIDSIPANAFANLQQLEELDVGRNYLKTIEAGAFNGLDQLKTLNLELNEFTTIPTPIGGLKNLRALDLSESHELDSINPEILKDLSELVELKLMFCGLEELKLGTFDNVPQLKILRLDYNNIRNVPKNVFNKLAMLDELNLSNNQIETLEPGAFDVLTMGNLNLSGNKKLKIIPAGVFSNQLIATVSLASCLIEEIKPKAFDGLVTEGLDLSDNKLTKIGAEDFSGLNARDFNVSRNNIDAVAKDAFEDSNILTMDLSKNPLKEKNLNEWGFRGSLHEED